MCPESRHGRLQKMSTLEDERPYNGRSRQLVLGPAAVLARAILGTEHDQKTAIVIV
jgi:hypothetical protein